MHLVQVMAKKPPASSPPCGHTELDLTCPQCKMFQQTWYQAAEKKEVFHDIEDSSGNLEQYDRRTMAFENKDRILDFFLTLDSYLTNTADVPPKERKILELYSQGVWVKGKNGIAKQCRVHFNTVYYCIRKYKKLLR